MTAMIQIEDETYSEEELRKQAKRLGMPYDDYIKELKETAKRFVYLKKFIKIIRAEKDRTKRMADISSAVATLILVGSADSLMEYESWDLLKNVATLKVRKKQERRTGRYPATDDKREKVKP